MAFSLVPQQNKCSTFSTFTSRNRVVGVFRMSCPVLRLFPKSLETLCKRQQKRDKRRFRVPIGAFGSISKFPGFANGYRSGYDNTNRHLCACTQRNGSVVSTATKSIPLFYRRATLTLHRWGTIQRVFECRVQTHPFSPFGGGPGPRSNRPSISISEADRRWIQKTPYRFHKSHRGRFGTRMSGDRGGNGSESYSDSLERSPDPNCWMQCGGRFVNCTYPFPWPGCGTNNDSTQF